MLSFHQVSKSYRMGRRVLQAVSEVSLSIQPNEVVGLVGASGSGKSTLARLGIGLEPPTSGTVYFEDQDIHKLGRSQRRVLCKEIQIVFQNPMAALNPRMTVKALVAEGLDIHNLAYGPARIARVRELLQMVGLGAECLNRYPHEFSGGQRQRICIARALAVKPRLLICDEPLSALDLSIQAQVVTLLKSLQKEMNLTYLFIAHDLPMVRYLCDRIAVMHKGQIVEEGDTDTLFAAPQHPHTQALIAASL